MITAGDELGRTQDGNNNAYCQDSPISWVHWDTAPEWAGLTELTQKLLELRAEHPVFRRGAFRHGEEITDLKGAPDRSQEPGLVRRRGRGDAPGDLGGRAPPDARHVPRPRRTRPRPRRGLPVWFHGGADPIEVCLPGGSWADTYTVVAHSGLEGELPSVKLLSGTEPHAARPYGRGAAGRLTPGSVR